MRRTFGSSKGAGGAGGGELLVAGTPEQVAADPRSHTGRFLAAHLNI